MKVLLINTCGGRDSLALADTGCAEPVVAVEVFPGRTSSEQMMPAMRRMFAALGWVPGEIGVVGVVYGPGSFTGVRVGLSAAKGFCEATGAKMVAISRLALVAAVRAGLEEVVVLLDAGRGEIYCRDGCRGEKLLRRDEVLARVHGRSVLSCEERVAESLAEVEVLVVPEPGPGTMLELVLERAEVGMWTDVASIDGNYLRQTDAELLVGGWGV